MVLCPICGHTNPPGATVCQSCGSPLGAQMGVIASSFALPAGTTLAKGRYKIERELGAGGFGITYKATDTLLSRPIAIKEFFLSGQCIRQGRDVIPLPTLKPQDYQAFRQEFINEARILAGIKHINKVEVYDVLEENNTAYMVMEFVDGKTLLKLLEERGGVMDETEAIGYITQVAGALEAVHKAGYLHRDVKPENIIVTNDGRAVLIDFGAARQFIAQKTKTMEPVLTPGYAPLEQYGTRARFGPPLDIYALGATLYHLLTGEVPVAAPDRAHGVNLKPPHQRNPRVSRWVSEAVMKAMEIEVAKRPQTVGEFLRALQAPGGAPLVGQPQVGVSQPTPKPRRTQPTPKPKPIWFARGLIVLALALGVWLISGGKIPRILSVQQPGLVTLTPTATRAPTVVKPTRALPTPKPTATRAPTVVKPAQALPTPTPKPTATRAPAVSQRACPRPEVCITYPPMDATLSGVVKFRGTATRPNFDYYKFEFKPEGAKDWTFLVRFDRPVINGVLMEWHTYTVPPGAYWLRLIVVDKSGNYWPEFAELRVVVADQGQRP